MKGRKYNRGTERRQKVMRRRKTENKRKNKRNKPAYWKEMHETTRR